LLSLAVALEALRSQQGANLFLEEFEVCGCVRILIRGGSARTRMAPSKQGKSGTGRRNQQFHSMTKSGGKAGGGCQNASQ